MTHLAPLSASQQRLWFAHRVEGPSSTYNVPLAVHLRGQLDTVALTRALSDVVERHGALRTSFGETDSTPQQRVHPFTSALVSGMGADHLDEADSIEKAFAQVEALATEPFDLATPPFRVRLIRIADKEHLLAIVMHHLICDGWSISILLGDLESAYRARLAGAIPELGETGPSYTDFAHWHHELLGDATDPTSVVAQQAGFWRKRLADLPDELSLPYDRTRKAALDLSGERVVVPLPADTVLHTSAAAKSASATEFMVLQSAVAVALSKFGAGQDIPLGTATSGRVDEALERLVGLCINTQVVRIDLAGDPTFEEVVARVRETSLAGLDHQDIPFERVVEAINPPRTGGRHPLFQVHVELHDERLGIDLPNLTTTVTMPPMQVAKFDLSFAFVRHGEELTLHVEFSRDLFDTATVERLADSVVQLLTRAVTQPQTAISAIDVLSSADAVLLDAWSHGPERPLERTVHESFEERVRTTPGATALVAGETRLTFAELNTRINRCAHRLIAAGIGPDDVVAMALPRSAEAVICWLAIGKSGGTYAPIDPHLPAARIHSLLASASPKALVTSDDLHASLGDIAVPTVVTDTVCTDQPTTDPTQDDRVAPLGLDHAAYVIFTSGSTGTPKAVTVLHRALANLWDYHTRITFPSPQAADQRRVALSANLAFDTSWEGVLAMIAGHELHLLDEPTRRDPRAAAAYVLDHQIDQLDVTPSFGQQLLAEGLLSADHVPSTLMFGGEAVSEVLWEEARAAGRTRVFNYYGPSEFCIEASGCDLADHPGSTVGRPVSNTQVLILDDDLRRVPPGVVGELYLAGANLGRGYLGQPGRTAERFVANPYGPEGSRMYRSGDLAKWDADGFLIFRGRADDQVKLRGFRIELEEIQRVIESHPAVAEAAVVLREDEPGDKRIVAYLVPSAESAQLDDLRDHVGSRLPDYMVPAAFVTMAALPLNRNAKLDRKSLPVPAYDTGSAVGREPTTEREVAVAALFASVLKVDSVGLDDNFFELGGHSLLATRLINQVRTQLEADLDLMAFFTEPTVAGIVSGLSQPSAASASASRPRLVRRD